MRRSFVHLEPFGNVLFGHVIYFSYTQLPAASFLSQSKPLPKERDFKDEDQL